MSIKDIYGRIKQKRKGTHGHGRQCGDCGRGRDRVEVEEGIRRINGKGKNTIKINY